MKQIAILILCLVLGEIAIRAQSTLEVSNLGLARETKDLIESDQWIAQEFFINAADPNSYVLNSIQLAMLPSYGNSSGFSVSIYSGALNGAPSSFLGTLSGSANPSIMGSYNYSSSGITLMPGTAYFVVASAATTHAQGFYVWAAADSPTTSGDWNINHASFFSPNDGAAWSQSTEEAVYQMAVFATPTPEPSVIGIVSLGGLAWVVLGRKKPARPFETRR